MTYRLYNADTIRRYAKDFHERAVSKGFWDEPRSVGHSLMLAFGEFHEAIEADRLGKWIKLTPEQIEVLRGLEGAAYAQAFLRLVKDTVGDEIADAVIRLLDLLGWMFDGEDIPDWVVSCGSSVYGVDGISPMLTDALMPIITDLCGAYDNCDATAGILNAIKSIEQLCDRFGIDLMTHIELKLKYNATRPAKHGKKY